MPRASRLKSTPVEPKDEPKVDQYGYPIPVPDPWPTRDVSGKKLRDHYRLDDSPASSYVQLKFKENQEALLQWPVAVKNWISHKKRQEMRKNALTEQDANEEEQRENIVEADEPVVDESAPNTPGNQDPEAAANQAFQDAAEPSPAPNDDAPSEAETTPKNGKRQAAGKPKRVLASSKPKSRLQPSIQRRQHEGKSILKPDLSGGIRKPARRTGRAVVIDEEPDVFPIDDTPKSHNSNEENESPKQSPIDSDDDEEMSGAPSTQEKRPGLKLNFKTKPTLQTGGIPPAQTPGPQSATARTPTIKLKLAGAAASTPLPTSEDASKPKKKNKKEKSDTIEVTPGSNKKRKRDSILGDDDDEGGRPAPAPPSKAPTLRKLVLKNPQAGGVAPKLTGAAHISVKVKGKVPKRPLGIGYDSELESEYENDKKEVVVGREKDPVVHEGFILRMQPGEDADYLRKSIEDGKAGEILSKGGGAIHLRMLDTLGRRGILQIKDHKYATSLVDLPCIIEGMKSWDKKGWIKSIDICQLLLVLGRCKDEEEARSYPLPEDVDPKTFQYAHGITAPMKWVRKRRFARTKRARVDDIEAVERRVHALLEADQAAVSSRYQLLDHDPRLDEHGYSTEMEEDEESDAEAEMDNYFDYHPGAYNVSTPMLTETPVQEEMNQEDVDALERMFFDEDKVPATEPIVSTQTTLQPPDVGDSSFAVTSTSATPSATAGATPAHDVTSDEEEEDGGEDEEDRDDDDKEGDESKRQAMERINDMTNKIAEQREILQKTSNAILKKKLARKIQDLQDDVAMMRKQAGLAEAEEDE